jgi:hypothetical protein
MYGGTPQGPKHVKVSEKFRNELRSGTAGAVVLAVRKQSFLCFRNGGILELPVLQCCFVVASTTAARIGSQVGLTQLLLQLIWAAACMERTSSAVVIFRQCLQVPVHCNSGKGQVVVGWPAVGCWELQQHMWQKNTTGFRPKSATRAETRAETEQRLCKLCCF